MTVYSYAQLEGLWINAGGPSSVAPLMAAIALAESGGNDASLNLTDNGGTQTSVGLWQVSNGTHSYPASWATASGNAQEAVAKYNSQGLTAWGTYTSGAYKQFLNSSTTPDTTGLPTSGSGSTASPTQTQGGTATDSSACLVNFAVPGLSSIPIIGSATSFCLLSKSQGRAILGAGLVAASGLITLVTLALLVTSMKHGNTGVKHAAGSVSGLFSHPQQTAQTASQTPDEALTAAAEPPAPAPIKNATLPAAPKRKAVSKKSPSLFSAKALASDVSLDDALAAAFVA